MAELPYKRDKVLIDTPTVIVEEQNPNDASLLRSAAENPKIVAFSILMTVGCFIFGFDFVIIGNITAQKAFAISFGTPHTGGYIFPALWLALWNTAVNVGMMGGSFINGAIADQFGRKCAFLAGALVCIIGTAISYVADVPSHLNARRTLFLVAKLIIGTSNGMLITTCQVYVSEIAPLQLRGILLALYSFVLITGQVVAISIIYARNHIVDNSSYRFCFAMQWVLGGIAMIVGLVVPESPVYLIRNGDINGATEAHKRLHIASYDTLAAVGRLREMIQKEGELLTSQAAISYRDCFRGTNWRRTRIIIYMNLLQQAIGVSLMSNGAYFLQLGGLAPSYSLQVIQAGVGSQLLATVVAWFAMAYIGRRVIVLVSTAVIAVFWLGIGIAGCYDSPTALWYIGIQMMVTLFTSSLGMATLFPVIAGETSALSLRAKSQSIGFLAQGVGAGLFNLSVPYMWSADSGNMGGKIGFFFCALCLFSWVLLWFELPEMKGRSVGEIDEMFAAKIPARKFKSYICEEDEVYPGVRPQ